MSRRLVSVDKVIDAEVTRMVAEVMAEDVISGRLIHNVDTDELMTADMASDQFRADATDAYARLLSRGMGLA